MGFISDLGLWVERISNAKTAEEAFAAYCEVMEMHGYNRVSYSLATDHPSLNLPQQHGLATSYPEDWMKYYVEKDYLDEDPIFQHVLSSRKPFFWKDAMKLPNVSAVSDRLMNEAEDAGIYGGIGFSLVGVGGEICGIGLARSDKVEKGDDYEFLASAQLLSTYFHETYRDLILKERPDLQMTEREYDILCWAAEGKNNEDIAAILTISVNTVRFHWKNIFKKLGANDRIYAVTKAIRLGLITPRLLHLPVFGDSDTL